LNLVVIVIVIVIVIVVLGMRHLLWVFCQMEHLGKNFWRKCCWSDFDCILFTVHCDVVYSD